MSQGFRLTLSCNNQPGIVARVATSLFDAGGNILEAQQFDDSSTGHFFMRVAFATDDAGSAESVHKHLAPVAHRYGMKWQLRSLQHRQRVLVLVSKADHCLSDLYYRMCVDELPMQLVGVVSNHPKESLKVQLPASIPFHHLPMREGGKAEQEQRIKDVIEETEAELIVLARYMQILSADLCKYLSGRCINIHHSFLPGFKGARPYTQAFERGVKMIGATAHYVTSDLDEGPIIAQDTESVSHFDTPDTLARKGRDIESRVLARSVRYHLEDRVLINGSKTVVFRD